MDEKMVLLKSTGGEVSYNFSDGFSFVATHDGVMVPESRAVKAVENMPGRFFIEEAAKPAPKAEPKKAAPKDEDKTE